MMKIKNINAKSNLLWNKAKKIIPGGNGLLSKRPDRYAPGIWPAYFKKSKGIHVTDFDGNNYIDMAQMGIGSSILGYANEELTEAIIKSSRNGVNCTLNSYEEVELAQTLIDLNPFAGGVKFARGGGEAMSIAIRIARAFSGRDKVLFSGYHGWNDWYLATNLGDKNALQDHLLPGLAANGVPRGLQNTAIPFKYNDVEDFLRQLHLHDDAGVICLEGARYDFPSKEFLKIIKDISLKKNIVIVCDEITSGWRLTDGGVYKINGFEPDIVVYGKALGGGYAISAVVGSKKLMDVAQDTFISSTMWTERIGFVAGLKTIEILTKNQVWNHLIKIGDSIGQGWVKLAQKYNIDLKVTDFKPLITFKLNYGNQNNALITFFTKEMLKRGYLAAPSIYVSMAHTEEDVKNYLKQVDKVFQLLSEIIKKGNISDKLNSGIRSDSFSRLT